MSQFSVEPLYCNEEDEEWSMEVPTVLEDGGEDVRIEWDRKNSDFFSYDEND